ncbi:MAG: NINE protein [Rikenellaceae bacterium]
MSKQSNCPKCGAKMNFDEAQYIMVCPYCEEEIRLERPATPPPAQPAQATLSDEQLRRISAQMRQNQAPPRPRKSKSTAIILCFFLGMLGIHQFYLGNTWRGIGYLVLTCSVVGAWLAAIILFIDFIVLCCTSEDSF